ncbi:hypothetical protein Q5752_006380 [Cryptotrichosporon argae]
MTSIGTISTSALVIAVDESAEQRASRLQAEDKEWRKWVRNSHVNGSAATELSSMFVDMDLSDHALAVRIPRSE